MVLRLRPRAFRPGHDPLAAPRFQQRLATVLDHVSCATLLVICQSKRSEILRLCKLPRPHKATGDAPIKPPFWQDSQRIERPRERTNGGQWEILHFFCSTSVDLFLLVPATYPIPPIPGLGPCKIGGTARTARTAGTTNGDSAW